MEPKKKYFWENETLSKILELLKKLMFVVGIPVSIYTFVADTIKEREEHEYFVYNNLFEGYHEYERLAAGYPNLGLSDAVANDPDLLKLAKPDSLFSNEEKLLAAQLMNMLISLHERAYLLYHNSDSKQRQDQFAGWKEDLEDWLHNERFLDAWDKSQGYYDREFEEFVNEIRTRM